MNALLKALYFPAPSLVGAGRFVRLFFCCFGEDYRLHIDPRERIVDIHYRFRRKVEPRVEVRCAYRRIPSAPESNGDGLGTAGPYSACFATCPGLGVMNLGNLSTFNRGRSRLIVHDNASSWQTWLTFHLGLH